MRKTTNIILILSIVVAVVEFGTGFFDQMGLSEQTQAIIFFIAGAINVGLGVYTNLKSGQEIKELKSGKLN